VSSSAQSRTKPASPTAAAPAVPALLQRKCACGGIPGVEGECSECQKKKLQRKPQSGGAVPAVPSIVHDVLRSPGQSLDPEARALLEPRFGHDFSRVRVHIDARAAESARAVDALAYTVGRDVVFGSGQYSPGTGEGRRLLAHELTHVVQQRGTAGLVPGDLRIDPSMAGEAEAEAAAHAVGGTGVAVSAGQAAAIQRTKERRSPGETTDAGAGPAAEPTASEAPSDSDEGFLDWLRRLLLEVIRVLGQLGTMPDPLPREAAPAGLPTGCATFGTRADLDVRKAHWDGIVGSMAVPDVISWIIGVTAPPSTAATEARRQIDCLMAAIQASASTPGSSLSLPPQSQRIQSPRRSFSQQEGIWNRKFQFRGDPFDRVTGHARDVCGSLLLPSEIRWDPSNGSHRACWGVPPASGATAVSLPSGARSLTDDERQQEILQASSAPGISRHHWGTDFDLFDPDLGPENWQAGQRFANEYAWLMSNAATYGFIQSFTPMSTFMTTGYIEERWHWSYWPIAQTLLEFARAHQSDINTELMRRWGSQPQFSFIRRHWREFMFNVNQTPRL
jgi:hypothetical protein